MSNSASDKGQRVTNLIRVKTGLEQVADGLKWWSGNGENGRSNDKGEFKEGSLPYIYIYIYIRYELNTSVWKLNLLTRVKIICTLGVWWNVCKE
jgi:hypothetical protein